MADSGSVDLLADPTPEEEAELSALLTFVRGRPTLPVAVAIGAWFGRGRGNHRVGKLLKEPGTSATGSITKDERQRRNKKKKAAAKARKRNR